MRFLLIAATLMLFAAGAAQAKVAITVDKDAQMMTVAVDGVERYHWPVSSGNPSHETPNGSFRAFRMEEDHYSKEFDDAPMPHSIFFTKIGHAIHGTESEGRLGTPVSHGCVRLSRANATTLYALVQEQGVLNTTVTLTGSSTVALARNPRARTAIARRDPAPEYTPQYGDAAGDPTSLAPQVAPQMAPRQAMPQVLPQVLPQSRRRPAPTTATSIRPTAVRPISAIRHRAQAAAPMTGRPITISSSSRRAMTPMAMRISSRAAIINSSSRAITIRTEAVSFGS